MNRRLFKKIVISVVFVPLSGVLSCAPHVDGQLNLTEIEQEWIFSKNNGTEYAMLIKTLFNDVREEDRQSYVAENVHHKLPVLLLFIKQGRAESSSVLTADGRIVPGFPPRIYMAIWEDGWIVWGACKDNKLIAEDIENRELEVRYYQSKVENSKIKKLLDTFADSSVWEDIIPVRWESSCAYLSIRGEGREYTASAPRIAAVENVRSYGHGRDVARAARTWERMTKKIFDLIPKEGRPVNISFKKHDFDDPSPYGWVGIVE